MKWTLSLGKLLGVRILVHWTFFLLLGWIVFHEYSKGSDGQTIALTAIYVLAIFTCVVLHEMGHILTARRFGINTKKITLLPIGGVASLERIPSNPKQELLVALAGPAVNIVIAIVIYPFLGDMSQYIVEEGAQNLAAITPSNFLLSLFTVNIVLAVFNMIPAFPMDGGRVLRALLALQFDRLKATAIASSVGQLLAVVFFTLGLMFNPLLALIAVFIFFGARGEHYQVQQNELLRGHRVEEAMVTSVETVDPNESVADVMDLLIRSGLDLFIVAEGQTLRGIVRREEILAAMKENKHRRIGDICHMDFQSFGPREKLSNIFPKMHQNGQTTFPVMQDHEVKGVISIDSLQRFMAVQSALSY